MNTIKTLIAVAGILFFGAAAFGQSNRTPADTYGPVRPDPGISLPPRSTTASPVDGSSGYPTPPLTFNEKLADKLKTMLPKDTNLHVAAKGFTALREFVTTVRVANNLNVPFWDFKHTMANGSSKELQKAIHELKPDADPKAEIKKANEQAKQDIKESKRS